ncbi:MAG: efflux RND transporter permease subunit [Phycisphaerae bacterium]
MINALIRWSLANRLAVVLLSAMLVVVGAFVITTVPVDVFPDLTAPTVSILVEGHGMAPEEMETLVTFPIETAVNGAANVRRVRSATAVGLAVVWVEFEWGTDIYRARQTVTERLATVSGKLPQQVETPVLAPVSSIMGEILFISLTSDRHGPLELRTIATTDLRRRLLSVPGVSQVTPIGGDEKQYQVVLSPPRLRAYGLNMRQVVESLRSANENVSAGFLVQGGQESILQGIGRIQTTRDIADTVVALRGGTPVRVSDLGVVQIGAAIKRGTGAASRRGPNWEPITEPAVIIAIQKQPGTNTLTLTEQIDAALEEMQASLPDGMYINKNLFRQADFIQISIHNTVEALRDGGIMVIFVVIAFLASMRSSVITLLAIPISLLVTVLVLKGFGSSINTMTLGGMAIAIGALVDDAIIDVENIVRRLRENQALPSQKQQPAIEIVFKASVEVRASIVFATLIILLVFLPLFFLSGVEGRLLQPLGIAFMVSLAASLLVALTVTPALSYYLLPTSSTVTRPDEPWVVRLLKRIYDKPLRWAMGHPWLVALPTALLLGLAVVGGASLGRSFLPEFNEGALVVGIVTLPGTSLEESDRLANIVQTTLMQHPEIVAIGRRTGRAEEDEHVQGVEASEIDLTLDMDAPVRLGLERRSKAELLEALRNSLAAIPGVQTIFGQPIGHRVDHMLSGTRANIAVKIFGSDLKKLRSVAKQIENTIRPIPGVVDLSTEQQTDIPTVRVEFDRAALARFGLTTDDAASALEAAFKGVAVTQILEGRKTFDLVVRVGGGKAALRRDETVSWMKASSREVREVLVDTPGGTKIPLKAVARISEERGPNLIMRENAQRRIIVQCNVAERDLGGVVDDIRLAVAEKIELPQGYYVEYGGQFESAEQTRRRLAVLGLVVVFGIGFLLHVVFRSVRDAALIMLNLPLALIGGVVGVYLSGGVLSVASLIGFIGAFGIAARNGIMMVSHIRHLQRFEGVTDFAEAVRRGAMERLAPILMTALCAGLALIPLALGGDQPGKEILSPMAMVILFGLLSSTFLNMIVVPALFVRLALPVEAESPVEIENDVERIGHALPAAPI